jgi:hypothetical protein
MSGIQLQIANDAIGGQPDDTSDDIVGVGVGRFDSKAPQERGGLPTDTISGGHHPFGIK